MTLEKRIKEFLEDNPKKSYSTVEVVKNLLANGAFNIPVGVPIKTLIAWNSSSVSFKLLQMTRKKIIAVDEFEWGPRGGKKYKIV